jgi:hypothetical protein
MKMCCALMRQTGKKVHPSFALPPSFSHQLIILHQGASSYKILWGIVFSRLNIFINSLCLASYGASEAVYPCNVVEKIHEYFRSKMRQYL